MSLRQKAIQGAMWSAIEKWGAQLVSTAIFLLLARLLGAEAFGLVALANVFMYFMQIFLDQGFAQAIIQKDKLEPEHLDTAFWTSVLMGALFLLAVLAGAGAVANFYSEPELAPIIRWMSISFLFAGLSSVQSAILQRNMQFKVFAARSLVATAACGVAGIGAALMGLGVWSLVIKEIVFGSTGALMLWSSSDWRPGFRFSPQHFRELFSFGINIIGFNFLNFLNRRSDDLLIGYFLGTVALGYYNVAYRLLLIMIKLLTNVTAQVALPTFSRLQKEPERMRNAFYRVTRYTSFVSFPAFLGMAVLAPELIQTLFGPEWLPSVSVMQILALIGILQSVQYFSGTVLLAMNKPLWRLRVIFMITVCNVIGFFISVRWGITAVAASYVICVYIFSPVFLVLIKKLIDIDFRKYFSQYITPLLSSLLMMAFILGAKRIFYDWNNAYITLITYMTIGTVAYLFGVMFLSPNLLSQTYRLTLSSLPNSLQKRK
ncbi:MOP flippase family protein [Adonisia turfae]|uniref:Colanic acid exporter n=1 Tax=Adonisia turfae CCMR0081 TaxID=2292702 RepID=A0A6M0RRF5_9CYAN|nr:MOP flippase family protein [Adonisia turfae]NEZ58352.1 colanic acid exporter [Adonisia turfae CCMR0081]